MARQDVAARRRRVLELMVQGMTPAEAAAAMGISDRSVRRYLSDPVVGHELRRIGDDRLRALSRYALESAKRALAQLVETVEDARIADGVRVRASRSVLEMTLRLHEGVDLSDRLGELEGSLAASA